MSMLGRTLGSYTIEEQLGAGGMAQVFRARHVHLERDVAIKVMHPHLAEQPELRRRFLNEARANASLKHAGIVQIYDFDVVDGICYIAMEMLAGQSLDGRSRELAEQGTARFPLDDALAVVSAVGEALSYAHNSGIVHRDIKPSNIMITHDGRAVLTDFGLAAVLDETRLTTDGSSAGTPSYMSPEQASGDRGDHRADIYSLAVVLYQLLSGELPLQSETFVGMINKLINEPAPPLSDKVPDVPDHVSAAVGRALEKDPARRFDSVDEMLAALHGGRVGATLPAATDDDRRQRLATQSPPRAAAGRWAVAVAATLLIGSGAWWLIWGSGAAEPGTSSGRGAAGANADSIAGEVDSTTGEVDSMVAEVDSMVPDGEPDLPSMTTIDGWLDGFDDNARGWETSSGPVARTLVDGEYEVDLRLGGQAVSAIAQNGGEYADFEYSSVGTLVEGQAESGYGLVFRRHDARNYYVFAVNGLRQWSLWALEDGVWRELRGVADAWTRSGSIVRGTNRLSVRAVGATISASVNGVELVSLDDATFSSGALGFYAASSRTASAAHTRVRFDDAEVAPYPAQAADAPSMVRKDGR